MRAHSRETVSLLRTAMGVTAESTVMSDDWHTIVARLEREASEAVQPIVATGTVVDIIIGEEVVVASEALVVVGRNRWLVGAAATIVVGLVLTIQPWNNQEIQTVADSTEMSEEVSLILPGEIVLSEDPLIVVAAIGPEVRFDTSELGQEVVFEPITELDDEVRQLMEPRWGPSPEAASLTKGTLIGRISGMPFVGTIVDGPDLRSDGSIYPFGSNVRFRGLGSTGGGRASGMPVSLPSTELLVNKAGLAEANLEFWGEIVAWGYLPVETAVVTLEGPSHQTWMRPRGGVGAFPATFEDGDIVTVVAYDADGQELGRTSEVVQGIETFVEGP